MLVDQRLLATDTVVLKDPETGKEKRIVTIPSGYEALLRQWDDLQNWLIEDRECLIVMDNVKRAARDWDKNRKGHAWLAHEGARLKAAGMLNERPDLAAGLDKVDRDYLSECAKAEAKARRQVRRTRAILGALSFSVIAGVIAWRFEAYLNEDVLSLDHGCAALRGTTGAAVRAHRGRQPRPKARRHFPANAR